MGLSPFLLSSRFGQATLSRPTPHLFFPSYLPVDMSQAQGWFLVFSVPALLFPVLFFFFFLF